MKPTYRHLALIALVIIAIVVALVFRYPLVTDDPFITYRYARNLLTGQGFVYNSGERVLSTTTPLYALVLAAFGFVLSDIPSIGFWLSVVSFAVCAWFIYSLAARFEMRAAGALAALLVLLSPGLVLTFGLETGFYLALALGAGYFYLREREVLAFTLLALLTITRSDGILLAAVLGLHFLRRQLDLIPCSLVDRFKELRSTTKRGKGSSESPGSLVSQEGQPRALHALYRPLLAYLLVLLPWLAFAWWWFGSPLPLTLTAKITQAQSGLWDPFALGFAKWLREWLAGMWPIVLFAVIGLTWCAQKRSRLLLLALWPVVHLIAYSILGVAFYAWYVAPLLPVTALYAGIGVERVGRATAARISRRAAFPIIVAVAGLAMLGVELRADLSAGMQQPSPKVQVYRQAAEWIAQNTPREATVDALEVGVIGYYDERRTFDFVGLVDPGRLPYLRSLELAAGVRHRAADYVIMIPPDVWLPQDPWFAATYQRVQQLRAPGFYSGKPLVIYQRVDVGRAIVESRNVNLSFEKRVDLLAVDLFSRIVSRGETLPVTLHLRADQALGKNFKFTLQLVGSENRVAAQVDTYYPSRLPEDGKPFADHQGLPVAPNASPGSYNLILAMYDAESGDRATLFDSHGNEAGDFVELGKIEIR